MNVEKTWLYSFARFLLSIVFQLIFRLEVFGAEHLPRDQNGIIFANHISAWDPLTIAYIYKHNEIHFFAKDSLFKNKLLAAVLTKLHAFPVRRGETDMKAMRHAMQVLKEGRVLGIFPEGHRAFDGEMQPIETGIAVMALKGNVPVTPVLIQGKYKLFSKLKVRVGAPILLTDLPGQAANVDTLNRVKGRFTQALKLLEAAN